MTADGLVMLEINMEITARDNLTHTQKDYSQLTLGLLGEFLAFTNTTLMETEFAKLHQTIHGLQVDEPGTDGKNENATHTAKAARVAARGGDDAITNGTIAMGF